MLFSSPTSLSDELSDKETQSTKLVVMCLQKQSFNITAWVIYWEPNFEAIYTICLFSFLK